MARDFLAKSEMHEINLFYPQKAGHIENVSGSIKAYQMNLIHLLNLKLFEFLQIHQENQIQGCAVYFFRCG